MKKNISFILLLNVIDTSVGKCQDLITEELRFTNYSNSTIYIKVYPISMIFNGFKKYNFVSKFPRFTQDYRYEYDNCVYIDRINNQKKNTIEILSGMSHGLAFDYIEGNGGEYGAVAFGKYKIEITNAMALIDTCTIEYDNGYPNFNRPDCLIFYNNNNSGKVSFLWGTIEKFIDDTLVNKKLESWVQWGIGTQTKNLGDFRYDTFNNNPYTIFPQDSRRDCNILSGVPDQNQVFEDSRSGNLTLNLTIDKNVATPNNSQLIDFPTFVSVLPEVHLTISVDKTLDFTEVISSNPDAYFEMNVENDGRLILNANSKIIVRNKNRLKLANNSRLYLGNGAEIRVKQGGIFCNNGALIRGNGRIVYEGGSIRHLQCFTLADYLIKDSTKFILESNAVLEIPDSTTLHFTGKQTSLRMSPNSKIQLGVGSKILFDSSATLIANGATFTSLDSTKLWEGITLSNSGIDSISNCTFSKAKTALTFISDTSSSFVGRVIKNNTFNIPAGEGNKGIYGVNNFRITIENNVFNMPSNPASHVFGVYLKSNNTQGNSSVSSVTENETPLSQYSIYILNNSFYNGTASIIMANYTSSYLPVFVKGNYLASASIIGILGRSINGTIRDNRILNYSIPMGMHLVSSSPALYNNTISSANVSLHAIGSSYPDLSPIIEGTNKMWKAGRNNLSSQNSDNIQLATPENVHVNLGENKFTIDTTDNYHIYGYVDSTVNKFFARKNCWNSGNVAKIYLRKYINQLEIQYETGYTLGCGSPPPAEELGIYYLGNGLYDTLLVNSDTTGSFLTEEELLYNQGKNYKNASMFTAGISTLKDLIDTYNYFYDLPSSLYDLYSCYEYLDTNSNQAFRDLLYGNLKIYLDDKIENGDYDGGFLSDAYNITLMCDVNMQNFNDAATGYEFISLFHPDPDVRLNASWDYAEITSLFGEGGGEKQLQISNYELRIEELTKLRETKELERITEIVNDNPVMRKMKESFEKVNNEKKERKEKQIKETDRTINKGNEESKNNELATTEISIETKQDIFKKEKARRNIFELKNLSKEELEKRRIDDMFILVKDEKLETDNQQSSVISKEYILYQNYPNPFNPSTTISFSIPENSFVKLKVYDILGKEVRTLVNDYKQSGVYNINFNGNNLPSGVYFYRIGVGTQNETGNYFEIKKMVLIK